jgi:hypothetical protein
MRLDFCAALLLALTVTNANIVLADDEIPLLKMTGADSAQAIYTNKCSNGNNIDKANRDKFVELMLANKKSRLAKLKTTLLQEIQRRGDEPRGEGVYIGEWNQTFHYRLGCGHNANSYSAFVSTVVNGNTNHAVVRYLVTIDDDDEAGIRTLKVRNIRPIGLRKDPT